MHGDVVNTAARLESFKKEGFVPDYFEAPCRIFVGAPTVERLNNRFLTTPVGEVKLKGKEQTTAIFHVTGPNEAGAVDVDEGEGEAPRALPRAPEARAAGAGSD